MFFHGLRLRDHTDSTCGDQGENTDRSQDPAGGDESTVEAARVV